MSIRHLGTFGLLVAFLANIVSAQTPQSLPASPLSPEALLPPAQTPINGGFPSDGIPEVTASDDTLERNGSPANDSMTPAELPPSADLPLADPASANAPLSPAETSEEVDTPVVPEGLPEEEVEQRLEAAPLSAFDPREQDEVWLISSRRLNSRYCSTESLEVRHRVHDHWQNASVRDYFAATADGRNLPTVIFVHGNRWSLDKAIRRGLQTYERTFVAWKEAPSVRFVIWTWPADPVRGPIRDVRIKAERADAHSIHLARFMQHLQPNASVSLIGHSYGGRVTLGALHLLGGGNVAGATLPHATLLPTPKVNLTLVVPAIRHDALITTRSRAYSQINHFYLLYNNRDSYLGLFRFTRFSGRTPAMGYTGICGLNRLPGSSMRVDQFNASSQVGPDHDFIEYITDTRVEKSIRRNLFSTSMP